MIDLVRCIVFIRQGADKWHVEYIERIDCDCSIPVVVGPFLLDIWFRFCFFFGGCHDIAGFEVIWGS